MVQKYLTEFYAYKLVPLGGQREVAQPDTSLEHQIRAHMLEGNYYYQKGRYATALEQYLKAWGLLPKTVVAEFPEHIGKMLPELMLKFDLLPNYLAASAEILKLRDASSPRVPIVAPIDPPAELVEVMSGHGVRFDAARHAFEIGRAYLEKGEPQEAADHIKAALAASPGDGELKADGEALLGTIALRKGDFEAAATHIKGALAAFQELKNPQGITAMRRNLEVVKTLQPRRAAPGAAAPGAAAPVGGTPGISLSGRIRPTLTWRAQPVALSSMLLKDWKGEWVETVASAGRATPTKNATVLLGDRAIKVRVTDKGRSIERALLNTRIQATSLASLDIHLWQVPQFVAYLAHMAGFVIPLAIADTYHALGDYKRAIRFYRKVRDYAYLNHSIERPMVWRKMARSFVSWGNRLYRDRNMVEAKRKYRKILRITDNGFELTGEMYSGGFAALKNQTLAFLQTGNRRAFNAIEYARRTIILEAELNLKQILANINYLGFSEDLVPIHTWRYLQNLARYLSNQAMQAERAYINFKTQSEEESFRRLVLEQAVDAQAAAVAMEDKRVAAAKEQQRVAQLSAKLAQTRLANAVDQRNDYRAMSKEMVKLEEINGWATGPMDRAEISQSWADVLGISPGTYDTYQIVRIVARKRAQLSSKYELANLDRRIAEQQGSLAVANAQVDAAGKMVAVAEASRELAGIRFDQAGAQLEFFDAQEFVPELWDNLAQAQRELSQRYLDWAIGGAFLMERAFEAEYDKEVNRIRFDYERSELHGLLAADFLLADIDQFSYDRILETEKQVPAKVSVSLAEKYPFQFERQFKQTGKIDFETRLDDFDVWQAGAHLRKLKRVEVKVEGLIGPGGVHGTLTNAGVSVYRDRNGLRKERIQKPETMILSRYDMRHDGFVFTADEGLLAVFENSGVAGGWILDFPPGANDLDYRDITDVHIVFYYDAYYSESVALAVKADIAANAIHEHTLGIGLRFQYPDEFFGFQDTGQVQFALDESFLPFNHTLPKSLDAYISVEMEGGVSPQGLNLRVQSAGGVDVATATNANGMIHTGGGNEPLNVVRNHPLLDTWTIAIPEAANAAAFGAGFTHEAVRNIYLYIDYSFTPRTQP